jgi:hypothetical protein
MKNCNHVVGKSTIKMNNTYQSATKMTCSDKTITEPFVLPEPGRVASGAQIVGV